MITGLPEPFPPLHDVRGDHNPAIRLFGKRFIGDQSAIELLSEFLAVVFCEKHLQKDDPISTPLPSLQHLRAWPPGLALQYRPPIKLNLKLFSFFVASRMDTRHEAHKQHYEVLAKRLEHGIDSADGNSRDVVEWLEELLRGFQGAGLNRGWCAQTFFPITPELLTKETIWSSSAAKRKRVLDWHDVMDNSSEYFSTRQRDFLARGGELLYLQLCNALAADDSALQELIQALRAAEPASISPAEGDPGQLHTLLDKGLAELGSQRSAGFDHLVELIENLDPETHDALNQSVPRDADWLACEWCPRDSWREGYLFAVELSRVLSSSIDPVERVEMLTIACALQVLRSLCAQSVRYAGMPRSDAPLGYVWLVAPPQGASRALRLASQRSLQAMQGRIQRALRTEALMENALGDTIPRDKLYKEADTKYGHKLFLSLGKKLGLVAPKRGAGARFTMTDDILRYLVLALLRPGERCTYDSFLRRLYLHYGIAVEGDGLRTAATWSGLPPSSSIQTGDSWLAESLRAGGFLTQLSDACAVVRNTYTLSNEPQAGGEA